MLRKSLLLGVFMIGSSVSASAQDHIVCSLQPIFAFQADVPARFVALRDSSHLNSPQLALGTQRNLVQFLVNSFGVVEAHTFKVLKVNDTSAVARARASAVNWIFSPARQNHCAVPQLVQLSVE
ncbi:MAG: hypothetical protein JWM95_2789 [Gemmatimonadetes bacterium]|nr:hypothetical protein [Gemmatimonadota bacterium]